MNSGAYADGSTDKKKKEKKGFKVDRYENYQRKQLKKLTGKDTSKNNNNSKNGRRVKAIVFDDASRREFLLTMHKRKNERRVKAFFDAKQKMRRENAKTRRAQREEARQAYNRFAAVPILPNFTYQLPRENEDNLGEEGEDEYGDEEHGVVVDKETFMDEDTTTTASKGNSKRRRILATEKTVHVMPSTMRGENDVPEPSASTSYCNNRIDDDYVTVEVKPLFGKPTSTYTDAAGNTMGTTSMLPSNDFSDLPEVVEQELLRLKKETKGAARTKPRSQTLKVLEKIRKIKKHSRKGHGKKTAKGKKRNRR
ncbi:Nucleolar protein 12 [Trypanosoma melophagium]|uniref:Nucleolar protein 12 n=1 Tax=Trypanosoma melophagium TaxID=715481 RepID=UPI00351A696E|nr:Nucleolar protein 12 [Trypanosoma melophagium]